jgi:DNA replication protein DnaC
VEVNASPPTTYSITCQQARDGNIKCPPCPDVESAECEHCGRVLYVHGMVVSVPAMGINQVMTWGGLERCVCPDAVEKWRAYDAEVARIEAEAAAAETRAEELARISRLIGKSGMGERFIRRTFETFVADESNSRAMAMCKRYADTFDERVKDGMGMMLSGKIGAGKTHLAASVANVLLGQGLTVVLLTMQRILDSIKDTYDDGSMSSTADVLEKYRSAALLIIDDLGKEQPTGWAQSELYRIVNDRYEQMRPVIVTTNYDDAALAMRLGSGKGCDMVTAEAIVSRLREMTHAVVMNGADRRLA